MREITDFGILVEKESFLGAWKALNLQAFFGEPEAITTNAHYFNTRMIITDPLSDPLNLGAIGYTPMKFKGLVRLYWLEDNAKEFIARFHHYKNDRKRGGYMVSLAINFNTRMNRTGACLQNMTMGFSPERGKWIVKVNARANEIAQRLYADLVFVQTFLWKICDEMEINYQDVMIIWDIDAVYQSVIGANLWMAMNYTKKQIKTFMNDTEAHTPWQSKVHRRYLANFNLDLEDRKVYNYSVQKQATANYDKILNGEVISVDSNDLYELIPGLELDQEVYDDLFSKKGGGR